MVTILKDALLFFRDYFRPIMMLTLMINVPFSLVIGLERLAKLPDILNSFLLYLSIGYSFLVFPYAMAVHVKLYSQIALEGEYDIRECLIYARDHYGPFLFASLCSIAIIFIGFILLIFPGIIVSVLLSLFPFFMIFEHMEPIEALKKSVSVAKYHFWKIFGPTFAVQLMIMIVTLSGPFASKSRGIHIYLASVFVDLATTLLSWLCVIILFRVYYIHRSSQEENRENPD